MKNIKKRLGIGGIALVTVLLSLALAVGAGAAASDVSAGYNTTITADNSTEELRITVSNITGTETGTVEVAEVTDSGYSQQTTLSVDTSASGTDTVVKTYSVPSIDSGNTTDYQVNMTGEGAGTVLVEKWGTVGSGGGLLGGGMSTTTLGGLALIGALLFFAMREEM